MTTDHSERPTLCDGVVYVAFGSSYVKEAIEASRGVRKFNPELPICLISDLKLKHTAFDFHVFAERQEPVIRGKLEMFASPFERTLFLDTDTEVFASLHEIFELLQRFDIVFQQSSIGYHYKLDGVPNAFPEPNTGVVGFVKSGKTLVFAELWKSLFDQHAVEMGREWDQRSFRHALYASDLRFAVLPPEYNFMPYFPQYAMTDLKIVHGRPRNLCIEVKDRMDRILGPRVYVPRFGYIGHYNQMSLASIVGLATKAAKILVLESAKRSIKSWGLYPTAQSAAQLVRERLGKP